MNENSFLRYIAADRDCEQDRLGIAVNSGIRKAKNDRFAVNKLLMLAAACVFTYAICFTFNLEPFKMAVGRYYQNWHEKMPGCAYILNDYIIEKTRNIKTHLGGE